MTFSKYAPFSVSTADAAASASFTESLTRQQQVQLESALSYHALVNPTAAVQYSVAIGSLSQVPALSDASTHSDSAITGNQIVAELRVHGPAFDANAGAPELLRFVRLAHPDASPATTRPPEQFSIPRRVYRELEKRAPLALDRVREFLMQRRERVTAEHIVRYSDTASANLLQEAFDQWGRAPIEPSEELPRAILFGLHWLQTGGAERWAVESIQIAKDAGFLPVVITDQNSVHPWADRPELDGCLVIELSFNHHEHEIDVPFAHALLENFNFAGLMLHHSHYLYQMLPWIKQHRPGLPVADSLHIVEYLGGGYPGVAVHFDEFIDTHHVISPQLVDWLTQVQGVDQSKLALAPLTSLTADAPAGYAPRDPDKPLTIAFVGRLSRQKRPDVFLGLVHRLRKQKVHFRAILHGDGEMRGIVDGLIAQFGLADVIEQRFEDTPVTDTLAESDVLIVTSINEGLTLTTFEAIAAGIPVISTDVGSQHTIVQGEELLPRPARPFIRGASALIAEFDADDSRRQQAWSGQLDRVTEFSALPPAHHFMKELFESWQA